MQLKFTLVGLLVSILASLSHGNYVSMPCASIPCREPAICENFRNDFICHCAEGTQGRHCEYLTRGDMDLCASNPCWHGGTCVSNSLKWACICPHGKTGTNCRDYISYDNLIIKVSNRGWYIADFIVYYRRYSSPTELYKQMVSLLILQDYTFRLPYDTDLWSTVFVANAVAGVNIFTLNVKSTPQCYDVWGTTLAPLWIQKDC